jgi:hypothetical protein
LAQANLQWLPEVIVPSELTQVDLSDGAGVPTLCTLDGLSSVRGPRSTPQVELVLHHPSGPELGVLAVSRLVSLAMEEKPRVIVLDMNFYTDNDSGGPPIHVPLLDQVEDIEDIRDAQLTAQWVPVLWVHCSSCQKWRLVPPTVFLTKKKRGEKFTCATVHPKGCAEPLKGDENQRTVDSS